MSIVLLRGVPCERCGSARMVWLGERIIGCCMLLLDDGRITGWCQLSRENREQFRREQAARRHVQAEKARVPR